MMKKSFHKKRKVLAASYDQSNYWTVRASLVIFSPSRCLFYPNQFSFIQVSIEFDGRNTSQKSWDRSMSATVEHHQFWVFFVS